VYGCVDAGNHIAHTPDITSTFTLTVHGTGSDCPVCIFVHDIGFGTRRPKQDSLTVVFVLCLKSVWFTNLLSPKQVNAVIRRYIFVMLTLKLTYFLIKLIIF